MGSSSRKKKEKGKDFQKAKLKVGKAKPKPGNFTDTSFKSKSIVLKDQSIHTLPPSSAAQFSHYLSLLSSRSDSQRREALGFLHHVLTDPLRPSQQASEPSILLLPALLPLLLDGSSSVRAQLVKLLRGLPNVEVEGSADIILAYVRAGMTHLSAEIRSSALDVLDWAMTLAGQDVVSCAGGWVKTLKSFLVVLGWTLAEGSDKGAAWTTGKAAFGKAGSESKPVAKCLTVLAAFLRLGLVEAHVPEGSSMFASGFPLWHVQKHGPPQGFNCYGYLDLFGTQSVEDSESYEDCEARLVVFDARFRQSIEEGLAEASKEGGEVGRAAGVGLKVLRLIRRS